QVANLLSNETPGISVPIASQQYQGSLLALGAISDLHHTYDVAASADQRLISRMLEPTYASWMVAFATSPEVLAYDPTNSAFSGINTSNWATKIVEPGLHMGIANASTDPNGYNEIFVLQLE